MTSRTSCFALMAAAVCVPSAAMAMASAELYSTKAYFYGRFEARIRFAPGDGVVSSFFLWKEGSEKDNAFWNELDIEKVGANCTVQTNAYYGNPEKVHEQKHSLSADMCGEYHDYRFEWTPTYITWSLDGKEIRRDTGDTANAYAQNASAGMDIHFNIWPGNGDFGGNIKNTKLPVHQYISWVQYSSYDNGNFKLEWREEFQTSGLPSGWSAGNWSSAYNLSTHNEKNVNFVNGIAVLSLTDDNATGYTATPPADPMATGSGGAGGTAAGGSGGGGGVGGTASSGGTTSTGGTKNSGGTTSSGGTMSSGGTTSTGGTKNSGGTTSSGGTMSKGGSSGSGGTTSSGGSSAAGGAMETGGTTASGGTNASGGNSSSGGAVGSGGAGDSGGAMAAGGTTTTASDGSGGTAGSAANDGGCSCSAVPAAGPLGPAFALFALVALRLRRRKR